MSRRAIRWLGRKAGMHPAVSLSLVAVLTLVAGFLAYTRLRIEMDVATLLPKDTDYYRERSRAQWLFGTYSYDFVLCVLEVKDSASGGVKENSAQYLSDARRQVVDALDDQRFFQRMNRGQWSGSLESLSAATSLLTNKDFDLLENRLLPDRLAEQMERLKVRVAEADTTESMELVRSDPFGIMQVLDEKGHYASGPLRRGPDATFYLSKDERMAIVVAWPVRPSTDLVGARELLRFLNQTREGLYVGNPEWREWLEIGFTGPHVENAEGTSDVREDMLLTSFVSILSVMLLFFVAFRQPEALLFVTVPLLVGVVWTLGFTSLFIDRITQITLTFAAILIGLGIDFSIHLYNRFLEDVRQGGDVRQALGAAIYHTGPSIMAGALTTGFGFFGMMTTEFQGFRELGLFGGIGILMSLVAVALTLPPLMVLFAARYRRGQAPIATLGLKSVTFTVNSYPRMTVCASLCILAFLGVQATRLQFNTDSSTLGQASISYQELLERIEKHFPTKQILVIAQAANLNEAIANNDQIYRNIESLPDSYAIAEVDTLRYIHPSRGLQLQTLQRFNDLTGERFQSELDRLANRDAVLNRAFFVPFLAVLREVRERNAAYLRESRAPISIERMDDFDFNSVFRNYVAEDPDSNLYSIITRVYPGPSPVWSDGIPPLFRESLGIAVEPKPIILGNAILSEELRSLIISDLSMVVLIVFGCVVGYLMLYFRSLKKALLAMVPVVFAIFCMLGVMQLMGMSLNYMNVIAIPMIMGIGVDSGIHLMGRFYENQKRDMRPAIERTGRAVVVTALTTMFGYGSLTIASFQGIREIGILAVIGTVATLFAALLMLPAILRMIDPDYTYRGGPGDEIG